MSLWRGILKYKLVDFVIFDIQLKGNSLKLALFVLAGESISDSTFFGITTSGEFISIAKTCKKSACFVF